MSSSATPTTTAAPSENALDFLRLDDELGEDEQLVRDAVARLVDKRVLPIIGECFEAGRFPRELLPELAELGVFGSTLQGYGCAGLNAVELRADLPRAGARRQRAAQFRVGAVEPVHVPDPRLRQRAAETAVAAAHGARRGDRLLRPDRAAGRFRSGQHAHHRTPQRRWLDTQWLEDVDHQRPHRRSGDRVGADARWHARLPGGTRRARLHLGGDQAQIQPARLQHRRAVLRSRCGCRPRPRCRQPPASRHRCPACRRPAMASAGA